MFNRLMLPLQIFYTEKNEKQTMLSAKLLVIEYLWMACNDNNDANRPLS